MSCQFCHQIRIYIVSRLMFAKYFQHHHGHNPNSARNYGAPLHHQEAPVQPQTDLGVIAARRRQTPITTSAASASAFHLGSLQGYSQLQGVEVQHGVAAARQDSLPLHSSVQQHLQTGYSLQQPLQASGLRFNSLQYQQPAVQHAQPQAFIGNIVHLRLHLRNHFDKI